MKAMSENEMRNVDGGWAWVVPYTLGVAYGRLMYEHWKFGSCRTRYYGLQCPVCGKKS